MTDARLPEVILRDVLDQWADGIARHAPEEVAALFTHDALFQGFDPEPSFGPSAVAAYYDKQPLGLTAAYELLQARAIDPGHLLGYASVTFVRPDGPVPVHLTVLAVSTTGGWRLAHYHASRTAPSA